MAKSWSKIAEVSVTYTENVYEEDPKTKKNTLKKSEEVTKNVKILGNTTAVHFFGEGWNNWYDPTKDQVTTKIAKGQTTVRKKDGDSYKFDKVDRKEHSRARPIAGKRIGAGKKVTLFTGAYGTKQESGTAWAPKTVTFQFPQWLKNRDILDAIRTLCNEKIASVRATNAGELEPYCEIDGVRYLLPSNSQAKAMTKVNEAEEKAMEEASDNSTQNTAT